MRSETYMFCALRCLGKFNKIAHDGNGTHTEEKKKWFTRFSNFKAGFDAQVCKEWGISTEDYLKFSYGDTKDIEPEMLQKCIKLKKHIEIMVDDFTCLDLNVEIE